jgi:hypothetical protein
MTASQDPLVSIDRTTPLNYPPWVKEIVHPKFWDAGPPGFDIREVKQHRIPKHDPKVMDGKLIYDYELAKGLFTSTLGLREFNAIQRRGTEFFRAHVGRLATSHKNAVIDLKGDMYVPFICTRAGLVLIDWCWIGNGHVHNESVTLVYKK